MSLRNRVRLIWLALILLWVVVWFRDPDNFGGKWELASAFLVIIVGIALANFLARRSLQQFRKALSIEDIPTAQREQANLVDFWRRRGRETMQSSAYPDLIGFFGAAIVGSIVTGTASLATAHCRREPILATS